MSGTDALRGYQYQLWCTLNYILGELGKIDSAVTLVSVESPSSVDQVSDQDIIDFALYANSHTKIVAQVKSSRTTRSVSGPALLRSIIRISGSCDSERYLVITNQLPSASAQDVQSVLGQVDDVRELRRALVRTAERSAKVVQQLRGLSDEAIERVSRCRVIFDSRDDHEVRADLRNRVRHIRRLLGVRTGPDSAGLLVGHLVAVLLETAADPEGPEISVNRLRAEVATPTATLLQAWGRRDWGRMLGTPPRLGEISRADLVHSLEQNIQRHPGSDGAPCMVLVGPSGIGKSNVALEYACTNADLYDDIYWVDASSPARVRFSFEQIARGAGVQLPTVSPQQDEELITYVHSFLASRSSSWALILDNASSRASVEKLIPAFGLGITLITSTDKLGWGGAKVTTLDIPVMTSDQAKLLVELRLQPDRTPGFDRDLEYIAKTFSNWPLALELGVNYLRSCGIALQDSRSFLDEFKLRALQDEASTPIGYPTTLVTALRAAFARLTDRSETDQFSGLALVMIRFAAYTLGRQIPVDLLLESALMTPWDATAQGLQGPHSWRVPDFPLAEILRAVERDFLMRRDEPLDLSLDELKPSLQVNEIVQLVIRDLINESEPKGEAEDLHLFSIAFYLQSWVSWFTDHDAIVAMTPILSHARHVADYALVNRRANFGLALLWGNLAVVLRLQEKFADAVRYLEAELEFLDREPANRALLRIQTRVALAEALWREESEDGTVTNVSNIQDLLSGCRELIPMVEVDQQSKLMNACVGAMQLLEVLDRHSSTDIDSIALSDLFEGVVQASWREALDDSLDSLSVALYMHALTDNHEQIMGLAHKGLADARLGGRRRSTFLRLLAEAQAALGEWTAVCKTVEQLTVESRMHRLSESDASIVSINAGLSALLNVFCDHDSTGQAKHALAALVDFIDEYELIRRPVTEADAPCIAILRAADACASGSYALQDFYLESVDFTLLRTVDPQRAEGWRRAFRLVAFADRGSTTQVIIEPLQLDGLAAAAQSVSFNLNQLDSVSFGDDTSELALDSIPVGEGIDGSVVSWSFFADSGAVKSGWICSASVDAILHTVGRIMIAIKGSTDCALALVGPGNAPVLSPLSSHFDHVAIGSYATKEVTSKMQKLHRLKAGQLLEERADRNKLLLVVDATDGSLQLDLSAAQDLQDLIVGGGRADVGVLIITTSTSVRTLGGRLRLRDAVVSDNLLIYYE